MGEPASDTVIPDPALPPLEPGRVHRRTFTITEQVGISEVSAVRGFTAFPNPSVAGNITFNYDLATSAPGTQLVVYNMLGERKVVKTIGAAQGTVVLNDGDLSSGVWFAVLERNGKPLATKRVVVVR